MIITAGQLADWLSVPEDPDDPFVVAPLPEIGRRDSGSASIDLRLGTWFSTLRRQRLSELRAGEAPSKTYLVEQHYVPFGKEFVLHPQGFVLGVTLEWLRLPANLAAYVIGKSSWGRGGLNIATATGVHPGFTGCLTLEISNFGQVPIAITPGMAVCQLFVEQVARRVQDRIDQSQFIGLRKPFLGQIRPDILAQKLGDAYKLPPYMPQGEAEWP